MSSMLVNLLLQMGIGGFLQMRNTLQPQDEGLPMNECDNLESY